MAGVEILRAVIAGNAGVMALGAYVTAGVAPQGTPLPIVSLQKVSSVDRNLPSPGAKRRVTERVQATVLAATYPEMADLLKAVKRAGADVLPAAAPAVSGISDVTIHTEAQGPDFMDDAATIHMGTQDFRVSYNETR